MNQVILSKKALCNMFGYVLPCGVCNYGALRRYVMTDELLNLVGLTSESYKSMKIFNTQISERLLFELSITPKMLEHAGINFSK